jgi:hypothetical protein
MLWLGLVFIAAFVGSGLPFWVTPYARIGEQTWAIAALVVVLPLAAGLRLTGVAGLLATVTILPAAMLTANAVRIAIDTGVDPTSHNLWPLELILTLVAGLAAAVAGYVIGMLIAGALTAIRR